eukprot:TRINITY_DN3345_c0_g1_i1.p1 TRINITY_DN3345_c0_g1~~TRINITY_DN3345_c0_g1_i1.p1  ORF type:complete len:161 (-),score=60.69 TRINITY_DN3345_c0_g1_i1:29-511(-)
MDTKRMRKHFLSILKNPELCFLFRDFLKSEFCSENLSFWMAVEHFKNLNEEELLTNAQHLHNEYIRVGSANEVNIDIEHKRTIEQNLTNPTNQLFDEAQEVIFNLMENDSFTKFIRCDLYKNFLLGNRPVVEERERTKTTENINKYLEKQSWYRRAGNQV